MYTRNNLDTIPTPNSGNSTTLTLTYINQWINVLIDGSRVRIYNWRAIMIQCNEAYKSALIVDDIKKYDNTNNT